MARRPALVSSISTLTIPPPRPCSFKSTTMWVGPVEAAGFLANNAGNRETIERSVSRYTDEMNRDLWMDGGVVLYFTKDGRMINGQHFCRAVVGSGQGYWVTVVTDANPDLFKVLDSGSKRRSRDTLSIAGIRNGTVVGSVAKIAMNYVLKRAPNTSRSNAEITDFAMAHPSIQEVAALTKGLRGIVPANAVAAVLFLADEDGSSTAQAVKFINGIRTGQSWLEIDDPRYQLVKAMSDHDRTWRADDMVALNMIRKAWNAYTDGRSVRCITREGKHGFDYLTAKINGFDLSYFR